MADIEIKSSELSEVIGHATDAAEKMNAALAKAKKLVASSSGYDQTWTGESKDSYLMYLGIVQQYHSDLATCIKNYKKALTTLNKDISTYDSSEMADVRGI
ncbi:WXG100 family type VII secretion target [uncultured Enterococcus sp.]|uniref:WXG100 family type VII secretion target n=1 Tax=uncultured Enterococcus sp. TaxID=167972 RepID=UPI002AA7006D|nr:hypothetical protein [uncultured Enterococcus sp.]